MTGDAAGRRQVLPPRQHEEHYVVVPQPVPHEGAQQTTEEAQVDTSAVD